MIFGVGISRQQCEINIVMCSVFYSLVSVVQWLNLQSRDLFYLLSGTHLENEREKKPHFLWRSGY